MSVERSDKMAMSQARQDFLQARRDARLRWIWSGLTRQNNALVPFEDLRKTLGLVNQRYRGVQPVPLDMIIGSLGRSDDFDRVFLPTQRHSRRKWVGVDSAMLGGVTLPPVSLYRVGEAYFVVDGHHRVSVARQRGQAFIDAEVTEVPSDVPVTADFTLEDLDDLAALRSFLEQTKLAELRPDQRIRATMPGDYAKLLDHIRVHKYFVDREQGRELSWQDAVGHWYDHVYAPVAETIRQNTLLADFPDRTETDLYLWLIDRAYYLSQELGQDLSPTEVARDYVRRFSRTPRRLYERVRAQVVDWFVPDELGSGPPAGTWREERVESSPQDHMFRDILVAVTGAESGWLAVEEAAEIARREGGTLHGMHVARRGEDAQARGQQVLDQFAARCEKLGVPSTTQLTEGGVAERIIERARWTDMVVINQRREHGRWAEQPLGTIFQTVAAQTPRPILAVPGNEVSPIRRVLLAYDGSPKAREALFVLRHLLCCWDVEGVILTAERTRSDREMLDMAWQYIQECDGDQVTTRYERAPAHEAIARAVEEEGADLLLMGSYGYQPLIKAVLGSTVDRVLRVASFPVLICR